MFENYLINSLESIPAISGIMGIVIGVILTSLINYLRDNKRFEKEKEGTKKLIKSEIETNFNALKKYNENYLIVDFRQNQEFINCLDINEFYINLERFPMFSHQNWNNLAMYIPSIYDEYEISKMIEFNNGLDNIYELSRILFKKQTDYDINHENIVLEDIPEEDWGSIIGNHVSFENDVVNLLKMGNEILEFLNNK